MKCLNCGKECTTYLCADCQSPEILEKIFNEVRSYKPETCENPYLIEYASGLTDKYAERDCLPDILNLFDKSINAYYYCLYYKMRRDNQFEGFVLTYLNEHDIHDLKTQRVLYELLGFSGVISIPASLV